MKLIILIAFLLQLAAGSRYSWETENAPRWRRSNDFEFEFTDDTKHRASKPCKFEGFSVPISLIEDL